MLRQFRPGHWTPDFAYCLFEFRLSLWYLYIVFLTNTRVVPLRFFLVMAFSQFREILVILFILKRPHTNMRIKDYCSDIIILLQIHKTIYNTVKLDCSCIYIKKRKILMKLMAFRTTKTPVVWSYTKSGGTLRFYDFFFFTRPSCTRNNRTYTVQSIPLTFYGVYQLDEKIQIFYIFFITKVNLS